MKTNITTFGFDNHELRTWISDKNELWFIAQDACKILDIKDTRQAVEKLDADEKLMGKLYLSGQERNTWNINEFGLYSLILSSNKPAAKKFKRWITHEVLPSIRTTGKYTTASVMKKDMALKKHYDEITRLQDKKRELSKTIAEKRRQFFDMLNADPNQLSLEM